MKNFQFSFFLFLLPFVSFSQDVMLTHNNSRSILVYKDNANLREKPSLESKIISRMPTGTEVVSAYENRKGVVNGKKGVWVKVQFKGEFGYVWSDLLVSHVTKSQSDVDYKFHFKASEGETKVKVFYKNNFVKHQSIKNTDTLKLSYAQSLGTTYNSSGNDIFVFYYGNYSQSKFQLFSWDGNRFSKFNKPLKDSSFYSYNYGNKQIVTERLVNFRKDASTNSDVITVLKFGDKVELINQNVKWDTINNKVGNWAKIKFRNDTGFLWQDFLSLYSFESYKEKSLQFVIKNSYDYKHMIVAIRDKKIVDTFSFRRISNFRGAHSRGNLGLKNVQEILGVCYSGESCGVPSGDVLIAWDGETFRKFKEEVGTGDGGLSYGESLIFPSHPDGEKDIIKVISYDSESIDI